MAYAVVHHFPGGTQVRGLSPSPRFTQLMAAFPADTPSTQPVPRPAAEPPPLYTSLRIPRAPVMRFLMPKMQEGQSKEGSRRHREDNYRLPCP